ncbi:MAG: tRNA (5-methylaminomethyl-2-thiouridine)(34)-methyltransferase MnmD [Muribaculaceae bacterium]|nr:tRNA (5-methylaminomethyl-2-thiouridine)(34)-methyltransferase MnmD [Muribaculaceae bacterium]
MEDIEITATADGSTTIYRKDLNEHYHSVKGALTESEHVYLNLGWERTLSGKDAVRIFEVGFGTGLNCALTAKAALRSEKSAEYFSVELYPLPTCITERLEYAGDDDFKAVNEAPWNEEAVINPFFRLYKINDDLLTMNIPERLDLVYFDAFAPEKQPELWEERVFRKMYEAMNPGGVLTTYCAKGSIRRMLQHIGFITERLPGPPGGKREVLRAVRP